MYIDVIPNRNSRSAILLRVGKREGKKIRKRTIANLTHWPAHKVGALRRLLKGEPQVQPTDVFVVEKTIAHGHVEAIVGTIKKIGLDTVIASKPCRECDLVVAMIAEQLIHPCSKLGSLRIWPTTTLPEELGVTDADEDDLYEAMDWLFERQHRIEKKLGRKHLSEGTQVLYDVTSSYYEGRTCPLTRFGNNRDGKKDKMIIVYGVLSDVEGRPIALEVYPGNTSDSTTVPEQVEKLRERFHFKHIVLVGDRGMLTQAQIDKLKQYPGLGWISALRFEAVRKLADQGSLQLSLFDHKNLAEIRSLNFPEERLIACYNPLLVDQRRRKRRELLESTEKDLEKIARQVARRTKKPMDKADIGQKVGKVINRYKVGKHFDLRIDDGLFRYRRNQESIKRESDLDGIYVIRTSEPSERLSAEDTVRSYKNLTVIERLFRSLKGIEILVRPIRHRCCLMTKNWIKIEKSAILWRPQSHPFQQKRKKQPASLPTGSLSIASKRFWRNFQPALAIAAVSIQIQVARCFIK
jgi:hypothetical protein